MRLENFALRAAAAISLGIVGVLQVPAYADDVMIPGASITQHSSTGIYLRADGSYRNLELPSLALGIQNITPTVAVNDAGITQSFNPNPGGYGLNGAIGYMLPAGWVPPILGADPRVELGINYVSVTGSQQPNTAPSVFSQGAQLLAGTVENAAFICGPPGAFTCSLASKLHTDFTSWKINLKGQSDFHTGSFTLTPSVALIGGQSDNNNTLSQSLTQSLAGATVDTDTYNANIKLHSDDGGARLGLDTSASVTNWLSVGLGGSIAGVYRSASLTGNDVFVQTPNFSTRPTRSALSKTSGTGAFLTNFEAHAEVSPMPGVLMRAVFGANFDNAVAGVSTPSFTGGLGSPTTVTPAKVKFSAESGWYVGGGSVVRF